MNIVICELCGALIESTQTELHDAFHASLTKGAGDAGN